VHGAQRGGAARADGGEDLVEASELGGPVVAAEQDLAAAVVEDERVADARIDVDLGQRGARRGAGGPARPARGGELVVGAVERARRP
jgi:hypothetical protein